MMETRINLRLITCYVCGSPDNITLSPERIDGEWQTICWPCENMIIISIARYRLKINVASQGKEIGSVIH